MEPAYLSAHKEGILKEKIDQALSRLESCVLCPRLCTVNRFAGETGFCRTGRYALMSSYGPHFGEEAPLVGRFGSGTIFFTHCNLLCVFCQNYEISHKGEGYEVSPQKLADSMVELQNKGVHNINFVTPSHVVAQILEALPLAIDKGLHVPLVYNSGGYDSVETLCLLEGVFDIYMPDVKFFSSKSANAYCNAPDYPAVVKKALKEMHRQVGDLIIDEHGQAQRGLLVRHLVMPEDAAGTKQAMHFLAQEISRNTYVNIMDQYHPCGNLDRFPELARRIKDEEFHQALEDARAEGITRLDDRQRGFLLNWR